MAQFSIAAILHYYGPKMTHAKNSFSANIDGINASAIHITTFWKFLYVISTGNPVAVFSDDLTWCQKWLCSNMRFLLLPQHPKSHKVTRYRSCTCFKVELGYPDTNSSPGNDSSLISRSEESDWCAFFDSMCAGKIHSAVYY